MKGYRLHMLSFENTRDGGFNVAFGNGANLQEWHLDLLEKWLAEERDRRDKDASDLI